MKIYKKYCKDSYKFSTNIANNSISLPSTSISGYDQDLIINILLKEIKKLIK